MLDLHLNLAPETSSPAQKVERVEPQPDTIYDLIVIGAGPAGLNAALYAKRKGRSVAVFGDRLGGQMQNTSMIENYIGTSDNSGYELSQRFGRDVERLGIALLEGCRVTDWQKEGEVFFIQVSNQQTYQARSLLLASGTNARHLGVPGEEELSGRGVSYCAICDGPLFAKKRHIVVGGGNAAVEAALDLARLAEHVTVVQRSVFRADRILLDELKKLPNVLLFTATEVVRIEGQTQVEGMTVYDKERKEERVIPAEAVFIEIGHIPNLGPFQGLLETTAQGAVVVDEHNQTSQPGVFAAGDVTDMLYKQIVIAAADGAKAALSINSYLTLQESRAHAALV